MNIIIIGMPRSYTSLVAKSYIDQGYRISNQNDINYTFSLDRKKSYHTYEPKYNNNDNLEIIKLANDINHNDGCVYKIPTLPLFFDQLIPLLTLDNLEFIFVIRNTLNTISSNLKWKGKTPGYHLLKRATIYDKVQEYSSRLNLKIVFGENYLPNEQRNKYYHNWKLTRKIIKIWELTYLKRK